MNNLTVTSSLCPISLKLSQTKAIWRINTELLLDPWMSKILKISRLYIFKTEFRISSKPVLYTKECEILPVLKFIQLTSLKCKLKKKPLLDILVV